MATKGEITKQKIIEDATRLFHRKGFGATSVNDLLNATGVTKGSLYFHYQDKEALGIAVLRKETEIYKEIKSAFGRILTLFKTYAHHPALLEANGHKVKRVMMEGSLSRKAKETIALLVSKDNGCNYCVTAHTGLLKAIGVSECKQP